MLNKNQNKKIEQLKDFKKKISSSLNKLSMVFILKINSHLMDFKSVFLDRFKVEKFLDWNSQYFHQLIDKNSIILLFNQDSINKII